MPGYDHRVLYGRVAERAAVDRLLSMVRDQVGSALVVRGQAGIGKSALLGYAEGYADGMCVLRAVGVESEAELAFATVHQLLRPLHDGIARLPAPQAAALSGAFGLSAAPASGPDRFLVAVAVLTLLADAAEQRPVLCLVDDAQWIDQPSADALVFVARRLGADGVGLLFAARDGDRRVFAPAGLPEIQLSGLDEESAVAMLADWHRDRLAPSTARELAGRVGGSPLALREVPALLTTDQLAGHAPLPVTLPLGQGMEHAFLDRVRRLPPPTQSLLEVVAAEDTGELAIVLRAAEVLGSGLDSLGPAELAGLVQVDAGRVEFCHPLMRSAVYRTATFARRREVHRALAGGLDPAATDQRAWHLAAAADGQDDEAAAALEATAHRARARSGYSAAASALERAAALSTTVADGVRRLALAAESAWLAGRAQQALALVERADVALGTADEETAAATWAAATIADLRGQFQLRLGVPGQAVDTLLDGAALAAGVEPLQALEMLMMAAEAASYAGRYASVIEAGRRAADVPQVDGERARFIRRALTGFAQVFGGEPARGVELLTESAAMADGFDDPRYLNWAATAAAYAGGEVDRLYTRIADRIRALGAVGALPHALEFAAVRHAMNGQFADALAEATEGLSLARDTGQEAAIGNLLAAHAVVAAFQGREEDCRGYANEALGKAIPRRLGITVGMASWALATLDLGMGRPAEALERYRTVVFAEPGAGHPVISLLSVPQLVNAAVLVGRSEVGRQALDQFGSWMERAAPQHGPRLAYCRALLAEGTEAEEWFQESLRLLAEAQQPLPRALTELAYGEHLRRTRQRARARTHLRAALEVFEHLGAVPWAQRASAELRASGETTRKRDPGQATTLTPQEDQIVRLVASGLGNRDIAAQLFLSTRTVEYHLRKVFQKLGITSRTELIRLPTYADQTT